MSVVSSRDEALMDGDTNSVASSLDESLNDDDTNSSSEDDNDSVNIYNIDYVVKLLKKQIAARDKAQEEMARVKIELAGAKAEVEQLQEKLNDAREETANAHGELNEVENKLDDTEEELLELKRKYEVLKKAYRKRKREGQTAIVRQPV